MDPVLPRKPEPPAPSEGERIQQAAAEVDRGLLDETLARSPRERLRAATRARRALAKFARHAPA